MMLDESAMRSQNELMQLKQEEGRKFVDKLAAELGYDTVSSAEELHLTDQEWRTVTYNNDLRTSRRSDPHTTLNVRFLQADRGDGSSAKALVFVKTNGEFVMDVLSPVFFDSHAGNHDEDQAGLRATLQNAKDGKAYVL